MSSHSDFSIALVLNVSDLVHTAQEVIDVIEKASGQSKIFQIYHQTYPNDSSDPSLSVDVFKIRSKNVKLSAATFITASKKDSDVIQKCSCMFESKIVNIDTKGDFTDYLFMALCPSMCIIRSIAYAIENCKKGMEHADVDKQLKLTSKGENPVTYCVQGKSEFVDLKLSKDLSHFVCFPNGQARYKIQLPNIAFPTSKDNGEYLENSFKQIGNNHSNSTHSPQIGQALTTIFSTIGVIEKETPALQLSLSDASGEEEEDQTHLKVAPPTHYRSKTNGG
jgi:hypothetical protein